MVYYIASVLFLLIEDAQKKVSARSYCSHISGFFVFTAYVIFFQDHVYIYTSVNTLHWHPSDPRCNVTNWVVTLAPRVFFVCVISLHGD